MRRDEPTLSKTARMNLSDTARYLECDRDTVRRNAMKNGIYPRVNIKTNRTIFTGEQVLKLWRAML